MNYYKFHIGDYYKSTMHLTPMEDLAYRRMIDLCYDTEKPLPESVDKIARLIRLNDFKTETQQILDEYFYLTKNGWFQKRIKKELKECGKKASISRTNGKLGGRPKKTQQVNLANPEEPSNNLTHYPLPTTHNPITNITTARVKTSSKSPPCPYQQIIDLYHETLPMCPKVVTLTDTRKRAIQARWRNGMGGLDDWRLYFEDVRESPFLIGKCSPAPGRKRFIADIDFLIRESSIVKTQEGKYHG